MSRVRVSPSTRSDERTPGLSRSDRELGPGVSQVGVEDESFYLASKVDNLTGLSLAGAVQRVLQNLLGQLNKKWRALQERTGTLDRRVGASVKGPDPSTDNAVARWDGSSGRVLQDSGVYVDDNGNVGIGDPSPDEKLIVLDNSASVDATVAISNTGAGDAVLALSAGGEEVAIGIDNSDSDKFKISDGVGFGVPWLVIDSTGKVGVGVASPAWEFHLKDSQPSDQVDLVVENSGTDGRAAVRLVNDARQFSLRLTGTSGDAFQIRENVGGTTPVTIEATTPNNTLYLDSSGKVGIGTAAPTAMVEIETADPSASGDQYMELTHTGIARWRFYGTGTNDRDLTFGVGATPSDLMTLEFQGHVGLTVAGTNPATATNRAHIYVKDAGSTAEPFVQDEDGDVYPLARHYGGISATDNSTETTISVAGTPVQVTVFDTNSPSSGTTPDHTNDHITVATTGDYIITLTATVNSVAGAASRFEMTVQKNNGAAVVVGLHLDRDIGGGGASSGVVSTSGIATLTANDTIEVWIENETNTQNYVVENVNLHLLRVG